VTSVCRRHEQPGTLPLQTAVFGGAGVLQRRENYGGDPVS
jgi:hypothetical protein